MIWGRVQGIGSGHSMGNLQAHEGSGNTLAPLVLGYWGCTVKEVLWGQPDSAAARNILATSNWRVRQRCESTRRVRVVFLAIHVAQDRYAFLVLCECCHNQQASVICIQSPGDAPDFATDPENSTQGFQAREAALRITEETMSA